MIKALQKRFLPDTGFLVNQPLPTLLCLLFR